MASKKTIYATVQEGLVNYIILGAVYRLLWIFYKMQKIKRRVVSKYIYDEKEQVRLWIQRYTQDASKWELDEDLFSTLHCVLSDAPNSY